MEFAALGTRWTVETDRPLSGRVRDRLSERVERFDRLYSRFRADSLVAEIARRPGTFAFPPGDARLFRLYRELYDATSGALTPLIGRALAHLGYDAEYSLRRRAGTLQTPAWDDVLEVSGTRITTTVPVLLDLGAVGKGYLVDELGEILGQEGMGTFVIDASGDLLTRGRPIERVGLEDPNRPGYIVGTVDLRDNALCASAVNRRAWGPDLHHILDPRTGAPAPDILATWVVHESCAVADGLATALFLVDPGQLRSSFTFDHVQVATDGSARWSDGFPWDIYRPGPAPAGTEHDGEMS